MMTSADISSFFLGGGGGRVHSLGDCIDEGTLSSRIYGKVYYICTYVQL